MAKRTSKQTFEDKVAEFSQIINELDDNSLPFETLMSKYEDGIKLGAELEQILNSAEQKIHNLEQEYSNKEDEQ